MAITMRMVARIFVFATEVTQGPLSSVHYTHIKHTPKSRCAICSGFEDTTKTSPRSRGTCQGDLAGDRPLKQNHNPQSDTSWALRLSQSRIRFTTLHRAALTPRDHPRDHPGKYLYYAGTFWLYLHSHCRLRNVTLVCVLCAYNGDLTMALV